MFPCHSASGDTNRTRDHTNSGAAIKSSLKMERFSAGLKSNSPLLKQGAYTKNLHEFFTTSEGGFLGNSPMHC